MAKCYIDLSCDWPSCILYYDECTACGETYCGAHREDRDCEPEAIVEISDKEKQSLRSFIGLIDTRAPMDYIHNNLSIAFGHREEIISFIMTELYDEDWEKRLEEED